MPERLIADETCPSGSGQRPCYDADTTFKASEALLSSLVVDGVDAMAQGRCAQAPAGQDHDKACNRYASETGHGAKVARCT